MTLTVKMLARHVQRMSVEQLRRLADDLDKRDPAILSTGRIGDEELPGAFVDALVKARVGVGLDGAPSGCQHEVSNNLRKDMSTPE